MFFSNTRVSNFTISIGAAIRKSAPSSCSMAAAPTRIGWTSSRLNSGTHGHVVALDFRGHGRSSWSRDSLTMARLHTFMTFRAANREHLGAKVVLTGHRWEARSHNGAPLPSRKTRGVDHRRFSPLGPPPLLRRLQWRWRRRAHGGKRPENSARACDIIRKFRLSPPGTYLTGEQGILRQLALKGALQLPNGLLGVPLRPRNPRMAQTSGLDEAAESQAGQAADADLAWRGEQAG